MCCNKAKKDGVSQLHRQKKNNCAGWIYTQVKPRIPALIAVAVLNMAGAYLSVKFALNTQMVIDSAVSRNSRELLQSIVFLGAVVFLSVMCNAFSLHVYKLLMADLDRDFKKNIMHKILRSDYSEVSRFHSGELINRMNGDVHTVYVGILTLVSSATSTVTSLVAAVAALAKMAPVFTVAIVGASMGIAFFTLLIQKKMKQLQKESSEANGKTNSFLQEAISKLLVVQALDVAPEIERRADIVLEERWQIQRKQKNLSLIMNTGIHVLSYSGGLVALIWCAVQLLNNRISFGELTAITQLVTQLQTPMLLLPSMIPQVISIVAACERILEVENIPLQSPVFNKDVEKIYNSMKGISARNMTFSYGRNPVFEQTDFWLPKCRLAVIVGNSGAGKSTLLKLFLGIYKPDEGELSIEGEGGSSPLSRSVRSLFSYAPQGNLLLSGTLRENLLLTRPDASEEELHEALYVSAMEEYVSRLPDGLDTRLGENGTGLSEGQAQRLSLARAVLSGAHILLLDEVTSALDVQTEQIVLERIRSLKNRTCIVVTHRPAALALADVQLTVSKRGMMVTPLRCKHI